MPFSFSTVCSKLTCILPGGSSDEEGAVAARHTLDEHRPSCEVCHAAFAKLPNGVLEGRKRVQPRIRNHNFCTVDKKLQRTA